MANSVANYPAAHRIQSLRGACPLLLMGAFLAIPLRAETADKTGARPTGRPIDDILVQKLETSFAATSEIESTTERRRALKRVARNAMSLLERHTASPNRYEVMGLIFRVQKELLILRNDARNRQALLEISTRLVEAPYDYAGERLEAETLLMQLELDRKGATEHERALAVAELADRYRGTPAEADSLMIAAELAFNLGHADLLRAFRSMLSRKFRENAKAIGFLKDRFAFKSSSLMFRGRFKRHDGGTLVLPVDRAGHVYLSCFWSRQLNDLQKRLMPIRDLQKKYPGRFEVLSFNLDELPDAGKSTLNAYGLDWAPMHLPDGAENLLFSSCGSDSQFLIRITNANGYIILTPIGSTYRTYGRVTDLEEYLTITLDKERFLSMTQAARIGDFLVIDPFKPVEACFPAGWENGNIPVDGLRAIQASFVAPPMRYRLSTAQAAENYARAARLCADVIARHSDSKTLWFVQNRRIIALMGLWNLRGEPEYLRDAVDVAAATIASDIPREAQIVPRFCLARAAIREGKANPEEVISDFIRSTSDGDAPALSVAAAVILGLDAGSPPLFARYHETLMDDHMDDPRLYALTAYLFNKFVTGRLFRGNYYSADVRIFHGFREWQKRTEIRPRKFLMQLEDLSGNAIDFPHSNGDKSNIVVFMELPADEASAKLQVEMVSRLHSLAELHKHKDMNLLVAFVSEDIPAIRALAEKNDWPAERVALVPDGLKNPHVLRLGIFLADQRPNVFTVAHDGTVTWSMSGMYQMSAGVNGVTGTVKDKVREYDLLVGEAAMKGHDYQKALRIFRGSFPPARFYPAAIKRAHALGRARGHKGLDNHEAALKEYDSMISGHTLSATRSPCVCYSLARKLLTRADILEKLGRDSAAEADRQQAKHLSCPRAGTVLFSERRHEQEIYNKLERHTYRKDWRAAFEYINDIVVDGKDGMQRERELFAELLRERAETLTRLGEKDMAQQDLKWAESLVRGIKPADVTATAKSAESSHSKRYVDVVGKKR